MDYPIWIIFEYVLVDDDKITIKKILGSELSLKNFGSMSKSENQTFPMSQTLISKFQLMLDII